MKFQNKISTKIKMVGALLVLLVICMIAATLYLNQQNEKDALIINIAGKQRMLTQKIAKNVFYIYHDANAKSFEELNAASEEFARGLLILEYGDKSLDTYSAPTEPIQNQLNVVKFLWEEFETDIKEFISLSSSKEANKDAKLQKIIDSIEKKNLILLSAVDKTVTIYTEYSESKTAFMELLQYFSAFVLILVFAYALIRLREIESHVEEFMLYYKKLATNKDGSKLEPINLKAESEIVEVSDTINQFIKKINAAIDYSHEALEKSQQASLKLDELMDEFDGIIDNIHNKSLTSAHLSKSEDIAIESTEVLLNSTQKLKRLKEELDSLIVSCQKIK